MVLFDHNPLRRTAERKHFSLEGEKFAVRIEDLGEGGANWVCMAFADSHGRSLAFEGETREKQAC